MSMMDEIDQETNEDIQIEIEDLNKLFEMNPIAGVQFQSILKDKQIAELDKKLAENKGHIPTKISDGEIVASKED